MVQKIKGFSKIENNLLFSNDLSVYSKLTLTALNYYTRNGKGKCFARKSTLSKMIGISLYKLRKALNELEQLELINIERPGLGNPDVIRVKNLRSECAKTSHSPSSIIEEAVKREEEKDVLTEKVQEVSTNTDEPEPDKDFLSTETDNQPETPLESSQDIEPIPEHLEPTRQLTDGFKRVLRAASYTAFIQGKIAVSQEDDEQITINCINSFIKDYLSENYTGNAEKITGKRVRFITLHGEYDGRRRCR